MFNEIFSCGKKLCARLILVISNPHPKDKRERKHYKCNHLILIMQRLSKLSQECISHKGLCCENRLNAIFEDGSIIKTCPYFKNPLCSIYKKRPIDCKTYPITIDLINNKPIFVIDLKCPAVKKGIIDRRFINKAITLWKENWPSKTWLEENAKDNKNSKMYNWITLEEYFNYKNKLNKKRLSFPRP